MSDPRTEANTYLKKHKVLQLFHNIGTELAYNKPADPNAFLLTYLKELQSKGGDGKTSFFTNEDLKVMFSLFDPTNSGSISKGQYLTALNSVGIEKQSVVVAFDGEGKVSQEAFLGGVEAELAKKG